jgi:hypothetical protein
MQEKAFLREALWSVKAPWEPRSFTECGGAPALSSENSCCAKDGEAIT